jgi:autotransporter-associated beta strand protein
MIGRFFNVLGLGLAGLLLFSGGRAWALPDSLTLNVTNTWTKQPVSFNLQRYNLRATNYQVRIYSDPTNFTLLPTNQIPEVTTYRGRITSDPGAVVVGTFGVDGKFYYHVSYGCRWQGSTSEYDPYDTTNRLSWGGMGAFFQTTNLPSLGYVTNYAVAPTNIPQHITWATNNYPTNPAVSYGGPPYLNNLKQVPVQRARLVLDSDYLNLFCNWAGSNITSAILIQEARINDVDYEQARDLGVCYQITCVCVRTNTQLPYTTTDGNLSEENSFWNPDPGYSHGVATNGWFDMVHGSVQLYNGDAGLAYDPGDFSVMDPSWSGYASGHEMGHNWGQNHYTSVRDYTGDNFWHVAMDGSGLGYSTLDANVAQGLRRTNAKGGIEWVQYNYQLAPHATPDLATTKTNQAVSINVLLNDYIANSNTLTIVSFETNTVNGGTVTNLGNGVLKYTPATNFVGYDLFHYYVAGTNDLNLKSLTAAKVLVSSDAGPLLGEWPLNETTGTTAGEATGNGTVALLYGTASFSSGSVPGIGGGSALHFDGSGYARFKGTWFDSYNTNLSISLWVKPDATPASEMMLFMKSSLDANNSPGLRFGMNGSSFFFTGCTVGGQSQFSVTAAIVPQAGIWYHLVGEIDRASGLIRLYVNGVEYTGTSNTRTIPAGEFIAADNWPVLGMANDGGGNKSWLVGALDDVRLYTKALSLAEVQSIYSGAGLLPAGGPHPYDGEGNVAFQPMLTWQPGGTNNFQYNVYLGTNVASVASATTNSLEFKGQVVSAKFIVTNALATNSTYCWRVDEIYGTNVAAGGVWSFTTAADGIHSGLKLYLSLDARDTSGTTTFDRSGAPYHDGTLYGSPTNAAGQVNEALSFNGSSTYVQTPALSMGTSNATFLAWLNLNGNQGQYDGVVMCHGGSTWSGMMMASANRLGYQWNDESGTWGYNSGPTLPTNQWVLAAVSVTNGYAVFYMGQTNGVITATTNNHTHIFQAFDAPVDVGQDPFGGRWFNGLMDEVCIWNRSLSAGEIGQILTNGINGASFAGVPPAPDTNTFTWIGGSDVYWTNALNWATNGTPAAANTVYFNDSAKVTGTQLGTNFSIYGINISGSLRSAGINGTNTLTLGAGGILMTNVSASLALGAAVALGTAQTWSVAGGSTLTLTNKLSGTGNPRLTLDGGGTFYLNNNNSGSSYGGVVFVTTGTLNLPYGWNTPSVTGNVSVGTNGTLIFNSHPYSYGTDNYTTNAGIIIVNGDNTLANLELRGGQITGTGDLRVGDIWGYSTGGKWASRSNSVTATINVGYLSLYNVNTTFTVENGAAEPDLLVSAPLKDGANGSASFTKTGLGSLTLTQPNTYTGNTTNSQGTINLTGPDNILPVTTGLYLATNTVLNLNGINQTVARLTGFGTVNLGSGSFAVTEPATNTFGGSITGNPNGATANDTQLAPPGGFALAGSGKIIFTNLQTYTGDTWVSSGTLALSGVGSLATSSNLVVASGATLDASARTDGTLKLVSGQTLGGFGSVAGKVVATNGAAIAPGNSINIGTLTFNSTVNLTGGQAQMSISKSGGTLANDLLTGITTLTCGGTLIVTNLGPDALAAGDSFKLFNATTFAGTFTNFNLPPLATNLMWNTSQVAVNGTLSVIAIVPPVLSGAALFGGGGFQLTFSGPAGQTYKILTSTNLALPMTNWTALTNSTFGATPVIFTNRIASDSPAGYFRIASP